MNISFYFGIGHGEAERTDTHAKNLWSQEYANPNYTVFTKPQLAASCFAKISAEFNIFYGQEIFTMKSDC